MTCTRGFLGRPCGRWRECDVCGRRRRGDQAWCIREASRLAGGDFLLLTVTAPGQDVLPYGEDGLCDYGPLSSWAGDMLVRWNRLSTMARMRATRNYGNSGPLVLASVWQLQKRGAPHIHVVVSADARGLSYASAVRDSASAYGFGFADIETKQGSAAAVGSYLSSYLVSAGTDLPREYVKLLPSRRLYVSRRLQKQSGATMAVAKKLRRLWVFANVDPSVGMPEFDSESQRAWVYYWYRVGLHGLDKVPLPSVS